MREGGLTWVMGARGCEGKVQRDTLVFEGRKAEPEALRGAEWRREGAVVEEKGKR